VNQLSKILIVDDDKIACETLASLLVSDYYEIFITSSGEEALEQLEVVKPDLILLDVMMPIMDGFEVCQKVRMNPVFGNIPIIMVTALDDRESKLRGIEMGADDYISKPYDRLELRLRIKTITRLNRFRNLQQEKERFEKLLQISPHGIIVIDQKCIIENYNQKFYDLLGISTQTQLLGNHFESYIHPDKREQFREKLKELNQNQKNNVKLQSLLLAANGFFLPVEIVMGNFLGNTEGGYQLNVRDISYEKKLETELNIVMKAVQQSQIMFMIMDLEWKITFCNPQCLLKTGYKEPEIIGTKFTDHYPRGMNEYFHNQMKTLRKEKSEWKGDLFCLTKTGETLKERASISPLTDSSGYITHFIKISEI
jgi:PAS domain S-box-containing protein